MELDDKSVEVSRGHDWRPADWITGSFSPAIASMLGRLTSNSHMPLTHPVAPI